MKSNIEIDNPKEIIDLLKKENPYIIKIKCIFVNNNKFIPYIKPECENGLLIIGSYSYPIELIQEVIIRNKNDLYKEEIHYNISSKYLKTFLNDKAIDIIKKHHLL